MYSSFCVSISTGGTSVSGYILAAPGRGRIYALLPFGNARLVSFGIPCIASCALAITAFNALSADSRSAATITTQSSSAASNTYRRCTTSCSLIPYAGSSSVCIKPAPYIRAKSASSLPKRRSGCISVPSIPAKPCRQIPYT
ncbi:MAG: hypothetical protein C5S38_04425 [Candidatus Methanophagaceae archaeon]|nr:MAG: hypothetical protein C5S38_04425 [Methanophagales archaeon]